MPEQQLPGPIATAEAVAGIRAALPSNPDSELTLQDMTTAVTSFVGTQIPIDSEMEAHIEQHKLFPLSFIFDSSYACRCADSSSTDAVNLLYLYIWISILSMLCRFFSILNGEFRTSV